MAPARFPILCYHRIADLPAADPLRPFSVTPRAFAEQITYLAAHGYRTVDLADSIAAPDAAGPGSVVLTFDDGYLEYYDLVSPLLRQHGFCATFFLVSDWLGQADAGVEPSVRRVASVQVREMARCGMAFGSHGRTHRRLDGLQHLQVRDEVAGSKVALEAALGMPVKTFAYPYGYYDLRAREVVAAFGYMAAVAVDNGSDDAFALRRVVVGVDDSLTTFAWKLRGWPTRLHSRWPASLVRRIIRREGTDV